LTPGRTKNNETGTVHPCKFFTEGDVLVPLLIFGEGHGYICIVISVCFTDPALVIYIKQVQRDEATVGCVEREEMDHVFIRKTPTYPLEEP
jgi:hypothetical protein